MNRVPQHVRITIDIEPGTVDQYRIGIDMAELPKDGPMITDRRVWKTRNGYMTHHNAVVISTLVQLLQSQLPAVAEELVEQGYNLDEVQNGQ